MNNANTAIVANAECPICCDPINQAGNLIRSCQNGHLFHNCCVNVWLHEHSESCPICRIEMLHTPQTTAIACATEAEAYKIASEASAAASAAVSAQTASYAAYIESIKASDAASNANAVKSMLSYGVITSIERAQKAANMTVKHAASAAAAALAASKASHSSYDAHQLACYEVTPSYTIVNTLEEASSGVAYAIACARFVAEAEASAEVARHARDNANAYAVDAVQSAHAAAADAAGAASFVAHIKALAGLKLAGLKEAFAKTAAEDAKTLALVAYQSEANSLAAESAALNAKDLQKEAAQSLAQSALAVDAAACTLAKAKAVDASRFAQYDAYSFARKALQSAMQSYSDNEYEPTEEELDEVNRCKMLKKDSDE